MEQSGELFTICLNAKKVIIWPDDREYQSLISKTIRNHTQLSEKEYKIRFPRASKRFSPADLEKYAKYREKDDWKKLASLDQQIPTAIHAEVLWKIEELARRIKQEKADKKRLPRDFFSQI